MWFAPDRRARWHHRPRQSGQRQKIGKRRAVSAAGNHNQPKQTHQTGSDILAALLCSIAVALIGACAYVIADHDEPFRQYLDRGLLNEVASRAERWCGDEEEGTRGSRRRYRRR